MNLDDIIAEVIAIGDELTTGQRLDTNTQWLSARLGDAGVTVGWHTTVSDDLDRIRDVIAISVQRARIVLITGGLGPTKDDLTRQAIADATGEPLELVPGVIEHIEKMFSRHGRTMSPANAVQAMFPRGAVVIDNAEGTAPGIDLTVGSSRIFAMPGVPPEMKRMWDDHVDSQLAEMTQSKQVIVHHVLRCFGVGESEAEARLPDLISRDREPRVGITASEATISFRISARGETEKNCREMIEPTIDEIRAELGDIVFGEQDDTLQDVVIRLLRERSLTVAVADFQFCGRSGLMFQTSNEAGVERISVLDLSEEQPEEWCGEDDGSLLAAAKVAAMKANAEIGLAIGKLIVNDEAAGTGNFPMAIHYQAGPDVSPVFEQQSYRHSGHSSYREKSSAKKVIDFLRLFLIRNVR